ncbi:hypothetical protein ACE1CA_15965 [Aerosakkonemataceae cyanobacterium BLCC-F167]|uniref:Uncharacterized protein n=1 Tax=Floridaenema evergladense BLCC-F167 TaxID=3153639 RepID=A0ABV4WMZ4_9CYAN
MSSRSRGDRENHSTTLPIPQSPLQVAMLDADQDRDAGNEHQKFSV